MVDVAVTSVNTVGRWGRQSPKTCHPASHHFGNPGLGLWGHHGLCLGRHCPMRVLGVQGVIDTLLAIVFGQCNARGALIQCICLPCYMRSFFCPVRLNTASRIPGRDKTNPENLEWKAETMEESHISLSPSLGFFFCSGRFLKTLPHGVR